MIFLHYINHILIDMENKIQYYQYLKNREKLGMGRRAISPAPEREEGKVLNKNTPQRIYIISI